MGTRVHAVQVTFYGVRGSTPCACDDTRRYGGNTSCVVVTHPGMDPVVFDLGTGLRYFGNDLANGGLAPGESFRGTALVSHLHWDHVQGVPFFKPWLCAGSRLDVYGPPQEEGSLEDAVKSFIKPPYFPVTIDQLPGEVTITEAPGVFMVGPAQVAAHRSRTSVRPSGSGSPSAAPAWPSCPITSSPVPVRPTSTLPCLSCAPVPTC